MEYIISNDFQLLNNNFINYNTNTVNITNSNFSILDNIDIDYHTIKYSTYSILILIIRLLIK